MSSDEIERRIEFIIEQQAQFSADLLKIEQQQARFNEQMDRLQENAATMLQAILGLIQVARTHDEQIDRNTEQINRNAQQIERNGEQIKELGERVDALIRVVESHVSNHP